MLQISPEHITEISDALNNDKIVALPTETVFGLAISLNSEIALEKLMRLKNRNIGSGKVFTLVPTKKSKIESFATIPDLAVPLIKKYFPGPLTLILPKNPEFSHPYFNNFTDIGLRIPDFPLIHELLKISTPLLLTSANLRSEPTCKTPEEVLEKLPVVDVLVNAPAGNTAPSTILKINQKISLVRKGALNLPIDNY